MIRASIDLGTNTCLLLIAECNVSGVVTRSLSDHSTIVRLGQGVDGNRKLHPDAKHRTLECLKRYSSLAKSEGIPPSEAICVATSQARDSADGPEFFAQVERETGFRFQVISGDDEAKFTFLGALLPGMSPNRYAVIDIGGGSTELMATQGGASLDIGSVRFTERYLNGDPVQDAEFWACQAAIDQELSKLLDWRKTIPVETELLAVAGTATTLAAWFLGLEKFQPAQIDSCTLSRGDVHRLVEELKWRTVAERQALTGIEKGRADVLLAGALILWRSMEMLSFPSARISTRGLRYGIFQLGKS